MASNVTLSNSVRTALSAMQATQAQAAIQQQHLATGKKVNSALDDPINFFTAKGLSNRSNDLSKLLDSMNLGIKTLQAADKGITALTKLVETAQAAARQALQTASSNLSVTGSALVGGATKVAAGGDAGTFSVKAGSVTTNVTVAAGDTVQTVMDALNASGTGIRAEMGTDNKLKISALNGESLDILAASTDATSAFLGITEGAVARTVGNSSATRTDYAKQLDDLRTQMDQLSKDAGFNGVNLLNGDSLGITFNESKSSSLTIKGVIFDSTGLGVKASTGNFQADSDINAALTSLQTAADKLRSQAATFGANLAVVQNRQDFTKGIIDTLEAGAADLVNADQNEEGAKLLALQTRATLATTALSISNQFDQSVLRLF